jgi:hypothetical protein
LAHSLLTLVEIDVPPISSEEIENTMQSVYKPFVIPLIRVVHRYQQFDLSLPCVSRTPLGSVTKFNSCRNQQRVVGYRLPSGEKIGF